VLIPSHHSKTKILSESMSRPRVGIRATSSEGADLDNRRSNLHKSRKKDWNRRIRLRLMETQRKIAKGTMLEKALGLCNFSGAKVKVTGRTSTNRARNVGIYRCRNSFCVSCSTQRTTMIAERVTNVVTDQLISGNKAYFGTLTMSKQSAFADSHKILSDCWTEFNRQFGQHIKRKSGGDCWYGGIRGFDVTFKPYSNTKTPFHLHIHFVMVFEKEYFSYDWIKSEIANRWCRVLAKHGSKGSIGAQDLQEIGSSEIEAALRYTVDPAKVNKSVQKKEVSSAGFELSGAYKDRSVWGMTYIEMLDHYKETGDGRVRDVLQEFYNGVYRKRQMSTFGKWRHLEKEMKEIEESIEHDHGHEEEETDEEGLYPDETVYLEYTKVVHNILLRYAPEYPLELVESVMRGHRLTEYQEFDALTRSIPYKDEYSKDDWCFVKDELLQFITEHTGEVFHPRL
jgi:hypothetical protein